MVLSFDALTIFEDGFEIHKTLISTPVTPTNADTRSARMLGDSPPCGTKLSCTRKLALGVGRAQTLIKSKPMRRTTSKARAQWSSGLGVKKRNAYSGSSIRLALRSRPNVSVP